MHLKVHEYNNTNFNEWDNFVLYKSLNGNIYHTQLFLSYHGNKFEDSSIMIYDKNKLIAIFPCCKINNEYYSHRGSTCGGIVILEKYYTLSKLNDILDVIYGYYDNILYISVSESIYFKDTTNALLVFLLQQKCETKQDISLYFDVQLKSKLIDIFPKSDNKRILKKHINTPNNIKYATTDDLTDYINFYKELVISLHLRNKISPLHTLDEFLSLKNILGKQQILFLAKNSENEIISGIFVIVINKNIYYTAYLMTNYQRKNSQIFFILYELYKLAKKNNIRYVNLGACSKNGGAVVLDTKYKMKRDCGCKPHLKYSFTYRKNVNKVYSSRLILKKMCRDEQFFIAHLWQKNRYAREMFFFENPSITYNSQIKWFELKNNDSTTNILSIYTKNEILIGYCGFKNITDTECELFLVILNNDYYNKKFGSECIETLIKLANKKSIYLHVKNENLKAIHLYKKYNFEIISQNNDIIKMKLTE